MYKGITFIIPTYNSGIKLEWCLRSIFSQSYTSIRVIVIDGGSEDNTLEIAGNYGCKILHNPKRLAEYGVQIGMRAVNTEFVCIFASDNELYDNTWAFRVEQIFKTFPKVSAVWGKIVSADWESNLNKYFVLIQSDPLNWFLNNNLDNYSKQGLVFKVSPDKPLVWGANGLVYRTDKIKSIWKQKGYLGDNDAFQTMIERGDNTVAYITQPFIYHHHVDKLTDWVKKWKRNTQSHLLSKQDTRNMRWVINKGFKFKLCIWLLYSLCFPISIIHSIYLIVRDRNIYWIYHPVCCFIQTIIYATELIKWRLKRIFYVESVKRS